MFDLDPDPVVAPFLPLINVDLAPLFIDMANGLGIVLELELIPVVATPPVNPILLLLASSPAIPFDPAEAVGPADPGPSF